MKRIILIVGASFLILLAACGRIEPRAADRATSRAPNQATPTLQFPTVSAPMPTALPAPPQTAQAGDFVHTIQVEGTPRTFRLHVPQSYSPAQPAPLVLSFHGFSSNAQQQERLSAMSDKADQEGFVAAYPEGIGEPQRWNFGPEAGGQADLEFVKALLADIARQYAIDPNHIYSTGISNGAEMTNHLGCEMADVFAALASVAGGYFRAEQCSPARPIPIVEFHGTADRLLPYGGDERLLLPIPEALARWANRNGCAATPIVIYEKGQVKGEQWGSCRLNADVVLYTIDGGGHSWPGSDTMPRAITTADVNATDVIWDFFAAHPKAQ